MKNQNKRREQREPVAKKAAILRAARELGLKNAPTKGPIAKLLKGAERLPAETKRKLSKLAGTGTGLPMSKRQARIAELNAQEVKMKPAGTGEKDLIAVVKEEAATDIRDTEAALTLAKLTGRPDGIASL